MPDLEQKRLAIFDIDKTLTPGYAIIDFAKFLVDRGFFNPDSWKSILDDVASYREKSITYNQFADLVVEHYAQGLSGQLTEEINRMAVEFWQERLSTIYPFVHGIFDLLSSLNIQTLAISGSSRESLEPLLAFLGFHRAYTTEIKQEDGRFLPEVAQNMASESQKQKLVQDIFKEIDGSAESIGFGDSIADSTFLSMVSIAVMVGEHDSDLLRMGQENNWHHIKNPNQDSLDLSGLLK
jgi:phosphoserine phosphatase